MSTPQFSFAFSFFAAASAVLGGSVAGQAPGAPVDFVHQIAPILKEHCGGCHLGDKKKGAFSMNTKADLEAGSENGRVLDAAHPFKSRMLEVLFSQDADGVMPPMEKGRARPTREQLEVLRKWIESGAVWQKGFAFQRPGYQAPVKPRLPQLPPEGTVGSHPLDRLMAEYLKKHGVPELESCDDATFARRLSLDLVGLLPEVTKLERFLEDASSEKRERLVDELLGRSEAYADHWLTFWNDLLRNDYGGTGFITGGRKQVTQWLYDALVSNKPYDRMVREIVNPSAETEGFALGITWRGTVSASQTREVQFAQSLSQSFLGLNMKCASCHDSFIDRWKLTDAYGLAAIYAESPIEIARCEKPIGKKAVPAWLFPEIGTIDPDAPRSERLKQLADLMTHPDNGWLARTMVNRLWAVLMGRGLVHPVDAMGTEPWSEELLDYLGWHLASTGYDLKQSLRLIVTSRAYQARPVSRGKDDGQGAYVFRGPRAKRMTAEQFSDTVWQITGTAPRGWDAPVRRGAPMPEAVQSGTLRSRWIREAALEGEQVKGRVSAVQQVLKWEQKPVKATGIVVSSSEVRVFVNGSEVKAPVLRTFGSVSELRLGGQLVAGENTVVVATKVVGREVGAPVRLEMEVVFPGGKTEWVVSDESWQSGVGVSEDSLKAGTKPGSKRPGHFSGAKGWRPVQVSEGVGGEAFSEGRLKRDLAWALQEQPPARASVLKSDLLMRTLGRPNRDQIVTSRPQDLSTLEALDLSAGEKLNQMIAAGAKRLMPRFEGRSSEEVVGSIYQQALCRRPTEGEKRAALEILGERPSAAAMEDLLWAMVVQPEFQLVR